VKVEILKVAQAAWEDASKSLKALKKPTLKGGV